VSYSKMNPLEENIEAIIWKHLQAKLDDEELDFLEEWLEDPAHQAIYKQIGQLHQLKSGKNDSDYKIYDVNSAWTKVQNRINKKVIPINKHRAFYAVMAIAASFVVGVMLWWLNSGSEFVDPEMQRYMAQDSTLEIRLEDGSLVALRSGSELFISNDYKDSERKVVLKGEAFFEVFRDTLRPFIVSTQHSTTEVLGTSFLIREVENGAAEIEVYSGKVKFGSDERNNYKELLKSQQSRLEKDGTFADKLLSETINPLYWKDQELIYMNSPVDSVIAELKIIFDINITWDTKVIENCRFTARFENPEPENIIEAMCTSMEWQYFSVGNTYIINNENCK